MSTTVVAASGFLGYGFDESSLAVAIESEPAVIACDSGSTDQGPCDLGSGSLRQTIDAYRRDLTMMIEAASKSGATVIVGTAGGAGIDDQVDSFVELTSEIASELRIHPKVAALYSEVSQDWLLERLRSGRVRPLDPDVGDLAEETVERSVRIVTMMGPEPIQEVVAEGAEVVICGRASDAGMYAAVPLLRGEKPGPSWHAGKILECGASAASPASAGDAMMAHIDGDGFIAEAPNPLRSCTALSIAAHSLYENADPYLFREPSGTLDIASCVFDDLLDGRARAKGSLFHDSTEYTVRLEGAEMAGYRSVCLAGVRDPRLIESLDRFIEDVAVIVRSKVASVYPDLASDAYQMDVRMYGRDGVMGTIEPRRETVPHEVGLLLSAVASDQAKATTILKTLRAMLDHTSFEGAEGLCSNLAYPLSPNDVELGPVYRFNMQHTVQLDDPTESVRLKWVQT